MGAARAAVLSPLGGRACPRRARGLGAPGCCSRPAREPPGKGPAGGRGGRGCEGGPPRSRVAPASPSRGPARVGAREPGHPAGATLGCPSPTWGSPGRRRPDPASPAPTDTAPDLSHGSATSGSGSSGRSHAEVGARKSGAQPGASPAFLARGARCGRGAPLTLRAHDPIRVALEPRPCSGCPGHRSGGKRESPKSGQGAGHFPAEVCACEGRP